MLRRKLSIVLGLFLFCLGMLAIITLGHLQDEGLNACAKAPASCGLQGHG